MSSLADRFLHEAGLAPDALPHDIRKAYARALKRIDQATEPQAFQRLRTAYEAALSGTEPAAAGELGEAREATVADTSALQTAPHTQHGQAMAAELLAWLPTARWARHDDVERLLMAALADTRLLALEARQAFEAALAARLAAGWRSGHQHLFTGATEVFGWDRDPARLASLGRPGRTLEAALQELQALHHLPIARRSAVGEIARALQSDRLPGAAFLARRLAEAEACCRAYPCWLQIVARPDQLYRWQAQARRLPRWQWLVLALAQQGRLGSAGGRSSDAAMSRQGWRLALAAMLGISLLTRLLPESPPSAPVPVVGVASNARIGADAELLNPMPSLRQTTDGHTKPRQANDSIRTRSFAVANHAY